MAVTTNTRKLAALLGASGAGIGTDGLMQSAGIDTDMATQAELDAETTARVAAAYDDTDVRQDLTVLALREAVTENRVAYNQPNSFIDQFQDDSGIGTETNTDRNASEYLVTEVMVATNTIPSSSSDWNGSTGSFTYGSGTVDGITGDRAIYADWESGTNDYLVQFTLTDRQDSRFAMFETEHIGDFISNNAIGNVHGMADSWGYYYYNASTRYSNSSNVSLAANIADGSVVKLKRTDDVLALIDDGVTIRTWSEESNKTCRFLVGGDGNTALEIDNLVFTTYSSTTNATGTMIGNANVPSAAQTKVSGVMLYKDGAGTATIGTDLEIYFTCNGGTNWTEAASYTTVTPVFSTGIKMVKLGETTCTSGSDVRYKAVWANQVLSSKETQLHGIGVNY